MIVSGDFQIAYQLMVDLNNERRLSEDYFHFIKAMADFKAAGDSKFLLTYIELYNSRNQNIIPPKVHDLNYLSRMVRFFEMAGEIDKASALVEEYFSEKSLKFHQRPKTREGFKLLKEALLRDKREGKNIYAQQLINTTDYFGFV